MSDSRLYTQWQNSVYGECFGAGCGLATIADDGGSTQRLSDEVKAQAPEVDWRALSGFRNVLVHDYLGGIDLERVWDAVEFYVPGLEAAV